MKSLVSIFFILFLAACSSKNKPKINYVDLLVDVSKSGQVENIRVKKTTDKTLNQKAIELAKKLKYKTKKARKDHELSIKFEDLKSKPIKGLL